MQRRNKCIHSKSWIIPDPHTGQTDMQRALFAFTSCAFTLISS